MRPVWLIQVLWWVFLVVLIFAVSEALVHRW